MPKRTTQTRTNARGTRKTAQGVTVKVDPALKRRWDALYGIVTSAEREGAIEFDRLWEAVGEIVDRELYVLGGFKDARDFFERQLGEKERNAYRFIRVARFSSASEESKYGVTKLDAALSFIEAKVGAPLAHPPLPIAFEKLRFPTKEGKKLTLEDARVADILAATRALSPKKNVPTSSAERALVETFGKHQAFGDVHFRVRNGLVNILGVPLASLGAFGTLLHRAHWVEPKGRKRQTKR